MIACLNVVVLALAAYVVFEEPTVVVRAAADEAPTVAATPDVRERAPAIETARVAAPEVPGAPQIDASAEPPAKPTTRRRTASRHRAREPRAEAAKREVEAAAPASKDLPLECIVDPAGCNRGRKAPTTEAQGPRANAPAEDLPATLSQSALRTGFGRVRAQAKACGPTHGAAPGETVAVKLSIAGDTGSITAAKPLGTHARTALGSCVAGALRGATFDRFGKAQIGLKYTVRL
jgi:hypothetical protein